MAASGIPWTVPTDDLLVGELIVGTANDSFVVNGVPVALINRSNYLTSEDDTTSLLDDFEDKIQAQHANAQVTFDTNTGLVTVSNTDLVTTLAITWTDIALRDLLGFTSNLSIPANSSITATNQTGYVWRAREVRASGRAGSLASTGQPEYRVEQVEARDGTLWTRRGPSLTRESFEWAGLPARAVRNANEVARNEAFERLWSNVLTLGRRVRYYRAAAATAAAFTGPWRMVRDSGAVLPAAKLNPNWDGRWSVRLDLVLQPTDLP